MSTPNCVSSTGVVKETIISGGQTMRCVGTNVWQADDGTLRFGSAASRERWYQENPGQQAAETVKSLPAWMPWALGGLALGGVAWLLLRK